MGLSPMRRQYVHLSETVEVARVTALRRTKEPVILAIDTKAALAGEISFFPEANGVWLSDPIPAKYISWA